MFPTDARVYLVVIRFEETCNERLVTSQDIFKGGECV